MVQADSSTATRRHRASLDHSLRDLAYEHGVPCDLSPATPDPSLPAPGITAISVRVAA